MDLKIKVIRMATTFVVVKIRNGKLIGSKSFDKNDFDSAIDFAKSISQNEIILQIDNGAIVHCTAKDYEIIRQEIEETGHQILETEILEAQLRY